MLNCYNTTEQVKSVVSNPLDGNAKVDIGPLFEMLQSINSENGNTHNHFYEKASEIDNFIEFLIVEFDFDSINGIEYRQFKGGLISLMEIRDAFQQIQKATELIKQQ